MTKTVDNKVCYNPMHEARDHAYKVLPHLHKYLDYKHVYDPKTCSEKANELYD